jgi:hypothetical protein
LVNVLAKPICLKRPNEHVMKPTILGLALTLNLPATGLALADKIHFASQSLRNCAILACAATVWDHWKFAEKYA